MLLIAFTGKKQSGKDSACRFLRANATRLWPKLVPFLNKSVSESPDYPVPPQVETFYVGGPMKEFAKTFGVPHELVWGDDKAKNTLIDINWEQLPHYHRLLALNDRWNRELMEQRNNGLKSQVTVEKEWRHPPRGPLTARQFLQQIGEEMFLGMDPMYWVKQFKAAVAASKADVGLVADPRKPEQVVAVQELGGIVFRLTRDPYEGKDQHISETALDPENFDWSLFDEVVDNRTMTVEETNKEVLARLLRRGAVKASPLMCRVEELDFAPQEVLAA
jgi:hypothetical protein